MMAVKGEGRRQSEQLQETVSHIVSHIVLHGLFFFLFIQIMQWRIQELTEGGGGQRFFTTIYIHHSWHGQPLIWSRGICIMAVFFFF